MKTKKILLTATVAMVLLGSCNNDYDGQDIAGSKLIVSASIDEVKTRVSDTGSEWTQGDAIGVSDNLPTNPNLNIKFVAGSTTGDFTSTTGIYVLGSEAVNYTAYYPYSGTEGSSAGDIHFSIVDADNKYVGHSKIDFMFAAGTATRVNPEVKFTFKHVMSKISLNITNGNSPATKAGDETAISYTLKNITTDGTFNTIDGTVTPGDTKGDVTVETTLGTASSIILPPLASETTATPIQLIIKVNDKVYSGSFTPGLSGSQEYQYNIDLNKTEDGVSLEISSPTIEGWTPNDKGDINVEETEAENVLEVGDFYLKDGTVIDKDATLDDATKTNVAGVVFFVGNPQPSVLYAGTYTEEQDILRKQFPACTHGLVLGLEATTKGSHFTDAEFASLMNTWIKNESDLSKATIYSARYAWDEQNNAVGTSSADKNAENNILGYNNTYQWKKFAEAKGHDILALTTLADFATANPLPSDKTSDWYIPSLGELKKLVEQNETVWSVNTAIAASLEKLGATNILKAARYWSSTEGRFSSDKAQTMTITYWKSEAYTQSFSATNNNTTGFFHFAFAF